jgi:hypothetical protein
LDEEEGGRRVEARFVADDEERTRMPAEDEREEEEEEEEERKARSMAGEERARLGSLAEEEARMKAAAEEEEKAQFLAQEERATTPTVAEEENEEEERKARGDARARAKLAVAEGRRLLGGAARSAPPSPPPAASPPRDASGPGDDARDRPGEPTATTTTTTTTSGASGDRRGDNDAVATTLAPDQSVAGAIRNAHASGDLRPRFDLRAELVGSSETDYCELCVREAAPSVTSATTTSVGGGESRYVNDDDVDSILVSDDPGVFALIAVNKRGGRARGIVRKDGENIEFAQDGDGGKVRFRNIRSFWWSYRVHSIPLIVAEVHVWIPPLLSHFFSAGVGQHCYRRARTARAVVSLRRRTRYGRLRRTCGCQHRLRIASVIVRLWRRARGQRR